MPKKKSHDGYFLNKLPSKRERVFLRDGYKCLKCESTENLTIDHIKPLSKGGGTSMKNLQTLCLTCNQEKGNNQISYRKNSSREDLYKQLSKNKLGEISDQKNQDLYYNQCVNKK